MRHWDTEQDRLLESGLRQGTKVGWIARRLGRSKAAVQSRARALGLKLPRKPRRKRIKRRSMDAEERAIDREFLLMIQLGIARREGWISMDHAVSEMCDHLLTELDIMKRERRWVAVRNIEQSLEYLTAELAAVRSKKVGRNVAQATGTDSPPAQDVMAK